jgi:hypothetical protein
VAFVIVLVAFDAVGEFVIAWPGVIVAGIVLDIVDVGVDWLFVLVFVVVIVAGLVWTGLMLEEGVVVALFFCAWAVVPWATTEAIVLV